MTRKTIHQIEPIVRAINPGDTFTAWDIYNRAATPNPNTDNCNRKYTPTTVSIANVLRTHPEVRGLVKYTGAGKWRRITEGRT